MDLSKFQPTEDAQEGKWFSFNGAEFKVAYYSRPEFNRIAAKVGKRYPKQALQQDPALVQVMTVEIMAEAVLMDWKGVRNNGVEIPCTKANKILALAIQPLRDFISEMSQDLANFTMEAEAEDAETLKSGSEVAG